MKVREEAGNALITSLDGSDLYKHYVGDLVTVHHYTKLSLNPVKIN